jgi:hypothetical protein
MDGHIWKGGAEMVARLDPPERALAGAHDEERARSQMTLEQLTDVIDEERRRRSRSPRSAGESRWEEWSTSGRPEPPARFRDEISALRAYAWATIRLLGPLGSPLRSLTSIVEGRSLPLDRVRCTARDIDPQRCFPILADFVDVGVRLETIGSGIAQLLFDYYVLGIKAAQLAEREHVDASVIGGRLSSARSTLRRALVGLIPESRSIPESPRGAAPDGNRRLERRQRVSRLIEKRLGLAPRRGEP